MSLLPEDEPTSTAALRAELEEELRNKKQCTYQSYECTQLCLNGYKFCSKHILQDKNAPFKQCSYVFSSNGKKCHLPAPKSDKKDFGYCNEHALRATLTRNKQNSKNQPPKTAEVLLHSLSHYVKKPKSQATANSEEHCLTSDENFYQKNTKYNDPFVDLDASNIYNECCNKVLNFCSESESDIEPSTLSSVWNDAQEDSSDDESIDSEQEDPLKHANVYTAGEVTLIIRDKLVRLQSLYVEQYRHLQYLLKEKRRKYLHDLKREKETCCNIYNQVRDNPKEQRLYKKLKALNNYQKCHGVDAILNKRLRDLRAKTTDVGVSKPHASLKCVFTEGGVKCGEKTLPLTKYCKKHILEDPNQVLFRACGKVNGDVECTTPIAATFDESTCQIHMDVPPLKSYNQVRKDSESDMDDSSEAANMANYPSDNFAVSIKHEFVPFDIPSELPKMETLPSLLFEENSQSLSESTASQSEIFNMTNSNMSSSANISFDMKDDEKRDLSFFQISESCTLVPSTSGLISINTPKPNDSEHSMVSTNLLKEDETNPHISSEIMTLNKSLTDMPLEDQIMSDDQVASPLTTVTPTDQSNLNEIDKLSQHLNISDQTQEVNEMEDINMKIKTFAGNSEKNDERGIPKNPITDIDKMEVYSEETFSLVNMKNDESIQKPLISHTLEAFESTVTKE